MGELIHICQWHYYFNSHWALKTSLMRIICLRNTEMVTVPKGLVMLSAIQTQILTPCFNELLVR